MSYTTRLFTQSLLAIVVLILAGRLLGVGTSPQLLVASVLALGASYAVAAITGGRHVRALEQLRNAARALAGGDLSVPPALASPGELGEVSDALRRVAEQLGARIEALQAEDALLSALIESLNEGVMAINPQQQVARLNGSGRDLLGMGEAPLPLPLDTLPRDATLHRAIQEGLRGNSTGPVEIAIGERKLALTTTPLSGGGAVVALFDLTTVRRLEQIRRDFVANVSHELRTPLTVVSGFAETLVEDDPPPEQRRQFADAIHTHTMRMQRIVDDLLDLSRMESGGWVPKPEPLELQEVVDDALTGVEVLAAEKGLALRTELPPGAQATADRTAVRQILTNLVENSLRHTDAGEIVIFAEPGAEGTWLGVRDTGAGISADHVPRIFERFYRADSARSRSGGGTGLGLAIVKHLAEAHGGSVRAESQLGKGTAISVFLPAGSTGSEE